MTGQDETGRPSFPTTRMTRSGEGSSKALVPKGLKVVFTLAQHLGSSRLGHDLTILAS